MVRPSIIGLVSIIWSLVILALVVVSRVPLPVYVNANGFVSWQESSNDISPDRKAATLVLLIAAENRFRLQPNQKVVIHQHQQSSGQTTTLPKQENVIGGVEPSLLNPSDIRQRHALDATTGLLVNQPFALAYVRMKSDQAAPGSIFSVSIEVGQRPAISYLPFIGEWFG